MMQPRKLSELSVPLLMAAAIVACDSDSSTTAPAELSVAGVVEATSSLSTLEAVLSEAGLLAVLGSGGPYTLFAPTDAAFQALPGDLLGAVLADDELLEAVLLNHVVEGAALAGSLSDGQQLTTLGGGMLGVTVQGGTVRIGGSAVIQADLEASNGVVHVIDAVLVPELPEPEPESEPEPDLVDVAVDAGFSTLVGAVQAAGLEEVLRGEGPFTVFAPTDEAFADLPEGVLEALLEDPDALAEILTYHVIPGRIFASDLEDGLEVTTVQGTTLTISLDGGARVNDAGITGTDILTANGVIHVIDAVLTP
jgi:transforming growth factor-beta-induced protein